MTTDLIFVTGMSGAGMSTALKMLEDFGYFCVDNLPITLIDTFVQITEEASQGKLQHVALGVDIRSGSRLPDLQEVLVRLRKRGTAFRILFLEADEKTLIQRYKETRRSHPLARGDRVESGIASEREKIAFLKEEADYILDTSQLLTRELRGELEKIFVKDESFHSLMVTVLSFGFKYGIPADADLVFDVRFLPNPYYDQKLRGQTGKDAPVHNFVMGYEVSHTFIDKTMDLLRFLIPNYIAEGKNQLVVAVGCTGGKHRSVTLAEELYAALSAERGFGLRIEHRDITKGIEKRHEE